MAIAYKNKAEATNNSTGAFAFSRAGAASAGNLDDIMVAVAGYSGTIVTPHADWTHIVTKTITAPWKVSAYWRKHTGASETTASWTFTTDAGLTRWASFTSAFSGVDGTTPIDVFSASDPANASSTSVTAPGVDPNYIEDMLVFCGAILNTSTWTPPTSFTEPGGDGDSPAAASISVGSSYLLLASGAATGDVVATASSAAVNVGILIGLKDASGTPDAPAPSDHPLAGTILAAESMLGYLGNQPSDTGVVKVEGGRLYYSRSLGVVGRRSE